jgi:hypothetical protein
LGVITLIITIILKYPDAVGEAQNVEPNGEGLYPGKACEYGYPPVRGASAVDKT